MNNNEVETLQISSTSKTELIDITALIEKVINKRKIKTGLCILHIPHTTAGITINEHVDYSVKKDILNQLDQLIPYSGEYSHTEGNAAAHIKASLMGCNLTLIIEKGKIALGMWQGIFFCEFDGPRQRKILLKLLNC
jgi:secondary thiamine-phosphate synthase enzyme